MIPAVLARFNQVPFPESSEEVRIQLLRLILECLQSDAGLFMPVVTDVASALSKLLTDTNPEMKEAAAEFLITFC